VIQTGKTDVRDMHAAHTMFRREFALMPALVREVAAGDKERVQIVADHVALLTNVLHHHHQAEDDNLWPRLLERAPKECDPLIELMERQHAGLEKALSEIEVALGFWRTDAGSTAGGTLAASLENLLVPLFDHMALEEERILPLAAQYMTQTEWDSLGESVVASLHENAALVLGMVMYEGDPDVIQTLLSRLAGKDALVLKAAAAQAFASHSLRVYGTATPPRSPALRLAG
jgi:hemerythrin-like domain-containing protein